MGGTTTAVHPLLEQNGSLTPAAETEATRPDFNAAAEVVYTKPPLPDFRPGGGLNTLPTAEKYRPESAFRTLVPEEHSGAKLYKLLMGAITPRPVAFVSTVSKDGVQNVRREGHGGQSRADADPDRAVLVLQHRQRGPAYDCRVCRAG